METEIVNYTVGYLAVRLALLAGLGYALYAVLRPGRAVRFARAEPGRRARVAAARRH